MNIEENNNIIQCFDEKLDLLNKMHNATLELDNNKIAEKDKEIERAKNACTEWLNKYDESENEKQTLEEENERLNNIINELEKELEKDFHTFMCNSREVGKTYKAGGNAYREHILLRLQELKGDSSNGN